MKQARGWRKPQPSKIERRWAYQQRVSYGGVVRVDMLDGSRRVFRAMPRDIELGSLLVANVVGKLRVLFYQKYSPCFGVG